MSGLALLLVAAAASAYGTWASLKSRPPLWAAAISAILFAVAGIALVLASWLAGDGIVLPGLQLSPGLKAYYFFEEAWDLAPSVGRSLLFLAPLAHLLLVAARRDRASLLRPLPATALLLWLFLGIAEGRSTVVQARGPERVAYLTIASREGKARLVLATGEPFAAFLRIAHVHETEGTPQQLHLNWTNDGKGLVVRVHEEKDAVFAVDLDGNVTGALPAEAREWPAEFVPPDVKTRFSEARMEVAGFIREHGGLAPP